MSATSTADITITAHQKFYAQPCWDAGANVGYTSHMTGAYDPPRVYEICLNCGIRIYEDDTWLGPDTPIATEIALLERLVVPWQRNVTRLNAARWRAVRAGKTWEAYKGVVFDLQRAESQVRLYQDALSTLRALRS